MRRPSLTLLLLCGASLAGAGCNHDPAGHGPGAPITDLASITIAPADQTLVIDGTTAATSAYTATGTFKDGHTEDITSKVTFSLADADAGRFAANAFTSTTDHGGVTTVFASAGS